MTLHEKVVVSAYNGCLMVSLGQLNVYAQHLFGRRISEDEYNNPEFLNKLSEKSFDDFIDIIFSMDISEYAALCSQRNYYRAPVRVGGRRNRSIRQHRNK